MGFQVFVKSLLLRGQIEVQGPPIYAFVVIRS